MLTGDANLRESLYLNGFINHYNSNLSDVSVLMMPHHGSKYNSDSNLLDFFPRRCVCYAAAKLREDAKGHPHKEVREAIRRSGRYYRTAGTKVWSKIKLEGII